MPPDGTRRYTGTEQATPEYTARPVQATPGAPPPVFAEKMPVLGILFDAFAEAIGTAGEIGYRGFFSLGLLAGLYLEVFFGVAVVCLVAGIVMRSLGGHEVEGRR
jgi:hypothetical protein